MHGISQVIGSENKILFQASRVISRRSALGAFQVCSECVMGALGVLYEYAM